MQVDWSQIKFMLQSRKLSAQYVIVGANYWIKAIDGRFELECLIPTDTSISNDSMDFVTNFLPTGNASLIQNSTISSQPIPPPFNAKIITCNGVVKKIFKRTTGLQVDVTAGTSTVILFTIPYAWCKITGADIIGGESLDTISLFVLDTTTGSYTTVPNSVLNQFGFNVNVSSINFINDSNYDADLYINMQIKIVYTSKTNKTIGVNLDLHEIK